MGVARTALLLVAFVASAAHAEIYSWRDATGNTQMSNLAPSWYSASEPSRVRTQVLVNGQLVDDTGLPQAEREKLQARRAKAESLGVPDAPAPTSVSASATAAAAPLPVPSKIPPPPVVPPRGGADAAKSASPQRTLEAQKSTDAMADQLKAASRPRQ